MQFLVMRQVGVAVVEAAAGQRGLAVHALLLCVGCVLQHVLFLKSP